jgi:hypothetical protein
LRREAKNYELILTKKEERKIFRIIWRIGYLK